MGTQFHSLFLKDSTNQIAVTDVSDTEGASGYYKLQGDSEPHPVVIHKSQDGHLVAFSAVCPHAQCTVDIAPDLFQCPCHGSEFDLETGELRHGPAQVGLTSIPIRIIGNLLEVEISETLTH
jgi:Rieske Fe-S protein